MTQWTGLHYNIFKPYEIESYFDSFIIEEFNSRNNVF